MSASNYTSKSATDTPTAELNALGGCARDISVSRSTVPLLKRKILFSQNFCITHNNPTFEFLMFEHVVNLADREKQMLNTQRRLPMFALQRTTGANSWELVGAAVGKLVGGDGRIPVVVGGRCCRH